MVVDPPSPLSMQVVFELACWSHMKNQLRQPTDPPLFQQVNLQQPEKNQKLVSADNQAIVWIHAHTEGEAARNLENMFAQIIGLPSDEIELGIGQILFLCRVIPRC